MVLLKYSDGHGKRKSFASFSDFAEFARKFNKNKVFTDFLLLDRRLCDLGLRDLVARWEKGASSVSWTPDLQVNMGEFVDHLALVKDIWSLFELLSAGGLGNYKGEVHLKTTFGPLADGLMQEDDFFNSRWSRVYSGPISTHGAAMRRMIRTLDAQIAEHEQRADELRAAVETMRAAARVANRELAAAYAARDGAPARAAAPRQKRPRGD